MDATQRFRWLRSIKKHLWLRVLIGLVLGIVVGVFLGPEVGWLLPKEAAEVGTWLAIPGKIFIQLIKLVMIPLVVSSIILGLVSSESMEQLRKMGLGVVVYFVISTAFAITIGMSLALLIEPGVGLDLSSLNANAKGTAEAVEKLTYDSFPEFVTSLIPKNPVASIAQAEMLGVVIATIIFGIALFVMDRKKSEPLVKLFDSIQSLTMVVVDWAMVIAPLAVFGLMAQLAATTGLKSLAGIGMYVLTVLLGLLGVFCLYMLYVAFLARMNPIKFLVGIKEAMLIAFSSSSSAATMPFSLRAAKDNLGVKPSIANFIVPIGATINMDGTALYQSVAAIFLAQAFGVDLPLSVLIMMMLTIVLASIGTPSMPGVGIIILATVLVSAGIPETGIAIILGVDRILDMCRTTINITGDITACKVFDRWLKT